MPSPRLLLPLFLTCFSAIATAQTPPQVHPQTAPQAQTPAQPAAPLTFTVTWDPVIAGSPTFTGRVYLMLSGGAGVRQEPRFGPAWFGTQPFFALDVKNWKPDSPLVFDDNAISFPSKISDIKEKDYSIQAVMRRNLDSPEIGTGEGTAYSAVLKQKLDGPSTGNINLKIDQVAHETPFKETDRIKLAQLKSDRLSNFYHRDITMRAAIILPKGYEDSANADCKYPALYWIGGFGSDHTSASGMIRAWTPTGYDDQIFRIVLDPSCYGGHHVFADSANNGPRGSALTEEFIPHLEKTYRLVASPYARFLSGHSSGGWSSLWLQITYPQTFGGTWSVAPDPVDFRDFQRIDLYKSGSNMYTDEQGARRPLARQGEHIMAWYDDFAKMEVVYGDGGQLRSFEWVFSPPNSENNRGDTGNPKPLYDRATGNVNTAVAESWKKYDIRLILENNWATLGPKLDDGQRINVFMGDLDTFYLDGATRLLQQSQEKLNSKATIEIEPGKDHGSIASPGLRKRIDRELMEVFKKHHPDFAPEKSATPTKE